MRTVPYYFITFGLIEIVNLYGSSSFFDFYIPFLGWLKGYPFICALATVSVPFVPIHCRRKVFWHFPSKKYCRAEDGAFPSV
jgi:hypothetical protein